MKLLRPRPRQSPSENRRADSPSGDKEINRKFADREIVATPCPALVEKLVQAHPRFRGFAGSCKTALIGVFPDPGTSNETRRTRSAGFVGRRAPSLPRRRVRTDSARVPSSSGESSAGSLEDRVCYLQLSAREQLSKRPKLTQ